MGERDGACKALCTCRNAGRSAGLAYHDRDCIYLRFPAVEKQVSAALTEARREMRERAAQFVAQASERLAEEIRALPLEPEGE